MIVEFNATDNGYNHIVHIEEIISYRSDTDGEIFLAVRVNGNLESLFIGDKSHEEVFKRMFKLYYTGDTLSRPSYVVFNDLIERYSDGKDLW